jgi:hypothetical protein
MTAKNTVRDQTMNLRTTKTIKQMVAVLAKAHNLSVARTIEQLIRAEHGRRAKQRTQS